MKKAIGVLSPLILILFSLTGCTPVGEKTASPLIIYIATTVVSLLLLIGYCCLVRKKNLWFLFLFSSVFIVNTGYLTLSISKTLEEALLANRISYLGSVFLPMTMLIITAQACELKQKKWFPILLTFISVSVFLITATPGYSDIYYKEVYLETINGVTVLNKVYGPWHILYLFYLLSYFSAMIICIIYATVKKKINSNRQAIILAMAVLVNIGVWFIEQLVRIDFEFLSISYIISELFLISLDFLLQEKIIEEPEQNKSISAENNYYPNTEITETKETNTEFLSKCRYFSSQLDSLTPTETAVYELYLSGKSTKEIMEKLNIKENTLKYHNKNIYSKLGVSSRKELIKIAQSLDT